MKKKNFRSKIVYKFIYLKLAYLEFTQNVLATIDLHMSKTYFG